MINAFRKKDPSQSPAKRQGSSLIIVLASLVLLMTLTLAFLTSVGVEFQSSKVYANGSSLRLLAQSSVNLVIGQLRVATVDPALCWASQPGMIRTYNSSGQPAGYFKLYSDSTMQGTGKFDHTTNGVPADWFSQKGVYVDLNQPVTVGGTQHYPIVEGDAADLASFSPAMENGTSVKALGPLTGGQPAVAGFWLKNAPVDTTSPNQAPMPVKWLYVLQDGRVIVPNPIAGGGSVSFTGTKPSASNPIVGRMAFWTDDETCKININTASEGTLWDTPHTYTVQDYYMATRQPVQGEFQRYPGHPATVSLSTVLGPAGAAAWTPDVPVAREDIYPMTPATKAGGSQGGTVPTYPSPPPVLPPSVSRLYSTVDEFLFQPKVSSNARLENSALLVSPASLDATTLKKTRFFLTANSQAPDVNIFNLPRISLWPITLDKSSGNPVTTPYDKLISFCTTINEHIFYFQRKDATSPTVDLPDTGTPTGLGRNRQLLEYLRALTALPPPGFSNGSGTFASKYNGDRDQILTELFDYIRATNLQDTSTGATIYARSLDTTASSSTYQGGQGQVVPIIDNVTTVTDSAPGGSSTAHPRGFGRFPTVQQAALVFIGVANNAVAYDPPVTGTPGFTGTYPAITTVGVERVQAAFVLQMFDPSQGPAITYPWYEVQVDGLNSLTWSNASAGLYPMGFPATGVVSKPITTTPQSGAVLYGGTGDFRLFSFNRGVATASNRYPFVTPPTGATSPLGICPDMNSGQIFFQGGSATVKIFALNAAGTRILPALQTISLSFPPATIPTPTTIVSTPGVLNVSPGTGKPPFNMRSFFNSTTANGVVSTGRFNMSTYPPWFGSRDAVRAVMANPGDMRLIAARTEVPSGFYKTLDSSRDGTTPLADYSSPAVRFSHMLRFGLNYPTYNSLGGKLVNVNYENWQAQYELTVGKKINDTDFYGSSGGAKYFSGKDPGVPSNTGVTTGTGVPADWDNGIGNSNDGSYINKADEGDAGTPSAANPSPYFELDYGDALPGPTFFSPNRMVPSAGMFGSLPSGVWANKPWQTLLFRPGPAGHPGLGVSTVAPAAGEPSSAPYSKPPDHLLLDLFNMPVVEPYAISTPLATAGRINMNYLMVPFTYIHRDTGLRAAMKAQMITAIPSPSGSRYYKTRQNPNGSPGSGNAPATTTVRYPLNAESTLDQFQARFDTGDIFRSASEICTIDLVPVAPSAPAALPITRANMDTFWASYPLSGDNVRERPYANLYPLLTTKSNTYMVHYRVQLLKQTPSSDYTVWREGTDVVTGQYRGSQTIERYIDPNDTIPDYADGTTVTAATFPPADPLSNYYKFRVISSSQFTP